MTKETFIEKSQVIKTDIMSIDRNKYSNLICKLVAECTKEIRNMFSKLNVTEIDFADYPEVECPCGTFNDDDGNTAYCCITKIKIENDYLTITAIDDDGVTYGAYLDETYGDYFDVADTTPKIYSAVADILKDYGNN